MDDIEKMILDLLFHGQKNYQDENLNQLISPKKLTQKYILLAWRYNFWVLAVQLFLYYAPRAFFSLDAGIEPSSQPKN